MGATVSVSFGRRCDPPVVRVGGELDLSDRDALVAVVRSVLDTWPRPAGTEAEVQLDLSGVSFMDCAGLSAVLRATRVAAEQSVALRVVERSRAVSRLLELAGADCSSLGSGGASR